MFYTLMNMGREIVRFRTYRNEYGTVRADDVKVLQQDLLPQEYTGDVIRFIEGRKAPKHRKHVRSILKQLGAEDVEGFIRVSSAASLTDTFWVRDEEAPKPGKRYPSTGMTLMKISLALHLKADQGL